MSFVWKRPEGRLYSPEQVARACLEVAQARGLEEVAAVLAVMCIAQESDFWMPANKRDPSSFNYPHDSESDDGRSVGMFQQQNGRAGEVVTGSDNWWGPMSQRMDLKKSCNEFLARLADNYHEATTPARASQFIQNVQRSAFPDAYAKHWDRAWQLVRAAASGQPEQEKPVADPNRPDFNEYPIWSPSNSGRGSTKVDLFLLHTQEGGGGDDAADNLARWLSNPANQVSYHYTISQASDGGVTVVDCVDTDRASWSVLSANPRSINLCFAGSRASWSRADWLKQAKAIDVAAYLAVQDCKKYGIPIQVIGTGGNYSGARAGIADHQYVTKVLNDGTHTDVGPNFPVDVFKAAVDKYAVATPKAPAPPTKPVPVGPADDQLTLRWNMLGGQTLVEAVAEIRDKVCGTSDRDKRGVVSN